MPTSPFPHIITVVRYLRKIMPLSILDVGLGNGKWGFIARDLLDVMIGERYKRMDWKVRIDGIEVFADYIQGHQRAIYNDIYIGDAFKVIDTMGNYDVIILGDVLEHFDKKKAWEFMDKCASHCNNYIVINIPLGKEWKQPVIYGNPHEEHISFWSYEQFEPFVIEKEFFHFGTKGLLYGCLLVKRDDYINYRDKESAKSLLSEGINLWERGEKEEGFLKVEKAVEKDAGNKEALKSFIQMTFESARLEIGERRIRDYLRNNKDEIDILLLLAKNLTQQERLTEANEIIEKVNSLILAG